MGNEKVDTGPMPARVVLAVLAFGMFLVTQTIRASLYIAVVAMIPPSTGNGTEPTPTNGTAPTTSSSPPLGWESVNPGWLLGAFYATYWATELPGGVLAQRLGGRRVLGVGVGVAGLMQVALPLAARAHYVLAVAARAVQGLALGVTWPAMHALSAHWIPATERSKFMVSYHGAAVGSAIVYPVSGVLLATCGWEAVFYATGGAALAWTVAWWGLVFDSPARHPRISAAERAYLERSIGQDVAADRKSLRTPWRAILSSPRFWAVAVASQGVMWGSISMSMQLPTYVQQVHRLDYQTSGLLLGLPELCKFAFGLAFSSFIDARLRAGKLTITAARKISIAINELVPAALLLLLGQFAHSDAALAIALLALSTAASGASSSGNLANIVDLSPNFAGTLLGLIKTSAVIPGVVSPLVTTALLDNRTPRYGWQLAFAVTAAVHACCCSVYLLLGSGRVQPWNQPGEVKTTHVPESRHDGEPGATEMQPLKE